MTIISKSIVLSPQVQALAKFPRIGYRNLFREGTVTVSGNLVSGPKENAYDGFTYDFWRSATGGENYIAVEVSPAESADYMAVAAHTLAGSDLTPQYSHDGATWFDLANEFQPATNDPIVWEFEEVFAAHYRLLIRNSTGSVAIGAIHVGLKLVMERGLPVGWQPPSLNEEVTFTNTMSEGGQILGRNIIRRGVKCEVQSNTVTWHFAREDWDDFIEISNEYACFFWWTFDGKSEIMYGGMTDKEAVFSTTRHLNVKFTLSGINR